LEELIGVRLDRSIKAGEYFTEGDLKPGPVTKVDTTNLRRPWGLKARFHDLEAILSLKPRVVEMHFSEDDVDFPFTPPAAPYGQRLIVHAPEFSKQRLMDLCSLNDELRESSIALIQRTIDKAALLRPHFSGPASVVIHVGGMTMDEPVFDTRAMLDRALEAFKRFRTNGIILLPENLPPRPWYLGGQWCQNVFIHSEEMAEFCKELGLGMTLDICHAQLYCTAYHRDLIQYVRTCLPYVRHLHLSDASGIDGEGLQIGEGVVPWSEILDLLSGSDFTWVPEIWSGHLHNAAGFVEALSRLAKFDRL
jgi:N-acetylneuraminate synthase